MKLVGVEVNALHLFIADRAPGQTTMSGFVTLIFGSPSLALAKPDVESLDMDAPNSVRSELSSYQAR